MDTLLKKYPEPITGLILGLAAAGNLVQSYGEIYRLILGSVSAILFALIIIKINKFPDELKENLQNPVIASVFPTLSMALMVLATYIKQISKSLAFILWIAGVILHIILIIWFTKKFTVNFKIKQVYPSWFIVYVGIVVASVIGPTFGMRTIGQIAFWFGLITYLILLPIVIYRIIKAKEMPEPTLPTLIIIGAPASLLLAGYMNSFEIKNIAIVYILMALSTIMYFAAIIILFKLLKLKFYPSYSGFTFPMVISGIAMKLTNVFFTKSGNPIEGLIYLVKFQEIVAVLITIYVLFRYTKFLTYDNRGSVVTK